MLSFVLKDINGEECIRSNPLSVTLDSESGVPADSLTVLFLSDGDEAEFSDITVYDGKSCIFRGIVDEQTETVAENGRLLELSARSMAALLLDNEAMPQSCYLPNMRLFMDREFSKLGFTEYVGEDNPKSGSMSIEKGVSEWSVLERYCDRFLGTYPRVDESGVIHISEIEPEVIFIPNEGDICLLSLKRIRRRCRLVSEYRIRTRRGGGYELIIGNEKADELKVSAVRYLNTVDNRNASIESCYEDIESGNGEYEMVVAIVSGRVPARVGDYVVIAGYDFGDMRVKAVRYELDGESERTRITMNIKGEEQ